jgi:hypothetical protein
MFMYVNPATSKPFVVTLIITSDKIAKNKNSAQRRRVPPVGLRLLATEIAI